jgi:hypothetical protein
MSVVAAAGRFLFSPKINQRPFQALQRKSIAKEEDLAWLNGYFLISQKNSLY